MTVKSEDAWEAVAKELENRHARGILVEMARNGQILAFRCEMPTCYCPHGPEHFDRWPESKHGPEVKWCPNPDHYPVLDKDGGELDPWNVRLAHVECNNIDYHWRERVRFMLEETPTLSFEALAEALNGKPKVPKPFGVESWTAEILRTAYVS